MSFRNVHRLRRHLAALLTGLLLSIALAMSGQATASARALSTAGQQLELTPLSSQPFFEALQQARKQWQLHPLGEVVANSPRGTVVNFYAVMAEVNARVEAISQAGEREAGLWWSPERHRQIAATDSLFQLAVAALDASSFPESVRVDAGQEATLQLKSLLDVVFHTSATPIVLPDAKALKTLASEQGKPISRWRIPGTAISLSNKLPNDPENIDFLFSAETVGRVRQLYDAVKAVPIPADGFTSRNIYERYTRTPGGLVPPKWYLRIPPSTRRLLELGIGEQTLLQIVLGAIVVMVGSSGAWLLIRQFIRTYKLMPAEQDLPSLNDDNVACIRVLLLLPILPLVRFSEVIIDNYINITGSTLEVITAAYFVAYFLNASALSYLTFDAIGRSGAEWLVRLRGSRSPLMLQRMNNLLLPICRTLGAICALFLLYRLLIQLGLPASTVLAFSAVPGLAIGLGASKLLGNLFAGLAIQTDRPLRVGEFCQVGENTGFITRIGLRSLELQTLESRITIPNAMADEATIVNYSRRSKASEAMPKQTLDLRLQIEEPLSPEQTGDLIDYTRAMLRADGELEDPLVSISQNTSDSLELICFAMVQLHGWPAYLTVRERVLRQLQVLIDQVKKSRIVVGVSYSTTAAQLAAIPGLIESVVNADPDRQFRSCRLMTIGEFSYDYVFDFRFSHSSYVAFKDGIDRLNRDLLAAFEAEGIEIPFPTSIELHG
ncbi:MAG: mechanosensitive ion channel family protein [Cyanobacteria bacterium M_surface_7_m2_040]|nr:mechanosensitive ion channel family protein [Cyanobacteria bacterium M_surface_7_m2_040]